MAPLCAVRWRVPGGGLCWGLSSPLVLAPGSEPFTVGLLLLGASGRPVLQPCSSGLGELLPVPWAAWWGPQPRVHRLGSVPGSALLVQVARVSFPAHCLQLFPVALGATWASRGLKAPQTGWLQTADICCRTVREGARSLSGRAGFPEEASVLPQLLKAPYLWLRHSSVCRRPHGDVSVSAPLIGSGPQPTLVRLHLH